MRSREIIISALTYSILRERCRVDAQFEGFPHNLATSFVRAQQDRLAMFLRVPMVILTWGFDAIGIFAHGRRFRDQSHARRWVQIEKWRSSRIGICRDFIRFHESLAVFAFFSMIQSEKGWAEIRSERDQVVSSLGAR